jgi:hypothetical protein
MADVQLENGFTRIANELMGALAAFDFTGMQRAALDLIFRLSYGCGKKTATVEMWMDFEVAGILKQNVKGTLKSLEVARVLGVDWKTKTMAINKNYNLWKIPFKRTDCDKRLLELVKMNLASNVDITSVMRILLSNTDITNNLLFQVIPEELSNMDITESNTGITDETVDPHDNKPKTPPKESKENKNIYIYTDLLGKLEFLPGIIDISKDADKEYFEYIKSFDAEMIDTVLAEAQRRTKLKSGDKEKLQRKSVLKFIAGGLESYDKLYASKQPTKKLTPKEKAVAQGLKVIRAYLAYPEMIQSKRQLSTLAEYYEKYPDYGELVEMPLEQFQQAIEGV